MEFLRAPSRPNALDRFAPLTSLSRGFRKTSPGRSFSPSHTSWSSSVLLGPDIRHCSLFSGRCSRSIARADQGPPGEGREAVNGRLASAYGGERTCHRATDFAIERATAPYLGACTSESTLSDLRVDPCDSRLSPDGAAQNSWRQPQCSVEGPEDQFGLGGKAHEPGLEFLRVLANRASGLGLALAVAAPLLPGLDLEGPGSVLEAVAVLALIVTVHEAGHFLAARSLGIHVSKFSVGFGPTILKFGGDSDEQNTVPAPSKAEAKQDKSSKSEKPWLSWLKPAASAGGKNVSIVKKTPTVKRAPEVEYSLRLFPLGGYVAFPDDDENDTTFASDDPDLLKNRPLLDRIIVVSAGVVANAIFAYSLLFTQVNTVGLVVQEFQPGVSVPKVISGGAGERGGLKDGDVIVAVQGKKLSASEYSVSELVGVIKDRPNQVVQLVVERDNALESLSIKPTVAQDGSGRINVQLQPHVETRSLYPRNVADGALLAWLETKRLGSLVIDGLRQLFLNFEEASERLSGPVAIVAVGAEVARTSASGLFQFAAIVNLNLAVVNILPLPALDGGFLLLLLVEGIRGGKKIPQDLERAIMSSGLLLLLTAGVILIVRDTLNLGVFSDLL